MAYLFGAHMSIAGGYYRSVELAKAAGCDCVQLFTKNNNQWACKPISDEDVDLFREALKRDAICRPLAHASYLINLASPNSELWNKSIEATVVEWQRAEQLGLDGVVVHPGAFMDSSEEKGLERIAKAIEKAFKKAKPKASWLLLENTAGQGSSLGWKIEHLGWLIERTGSAMNVGICLDTCHAHAAGYDLSEPKGLKSLVADLEAHGLREALRAIHLNDSKKGCGSRVDRHEHIGLGTIGLEGFKRFLKHPMVKKLPMYLETDKGKNDDGCDWDMVNLETLRQLVA